MGEESSMKEDTKNIVVLGLVLGIVSYGSQKENKR